MDGFICHYVLSHLLALTCDEEGDEILRMPTDRLQQTIDLFQSAHDSLCLLVDLLSKAGWRLMFIEIFSLRQ